MVTASATGTGRARRPRLLLVEDEEIIRRIVVRALPEYDVIEKEDAEGALDAMVANPADLVITDIVLPHMDGCAMTARIRDRWPGVSVIAISGHVGDRDVEEFGFDGFLNKPIDLKSLRGTVASLLQQT